MNVLDLYEECARLIEEGAALREVVRYDEEGDLVPLIFVEVNGEDEVILGG